MRKVECDRGVNLRQLNSADLSVWAESRAHTIYTMYWPDCLPKPTDQLCSIGADSPPPCHTLPYSMVGTIKMLLHSNREKNPLFVQVPTLCILGLKGTLIFGIHESFQSI